MTNEASILFASDDQPNGVRRNSVKSAARKLKPALAWAVSVLAQFGGAIASIPGSVGSAFQMAYVDPFAASAGRRVGDRDR